MEVINATREDAASLAALYAKGFQSTGFGQIAAAEKREELIEWLEEHCAKGNVWFRCDGDGPLVLGHFEPDKDEVVMIVTRGDAHCEGHASGMLTKLVTLYPSARLRPVTRGGEAVAKKCGFFPSQDDPAVWVRISD